MRHGIHVMRVVAIKLRKRQQYGRSIKVDKIRVYYAQGKREEKAGTQDM